MYVDGHNTKSEPGLKDYLTLLSVEQTCAYRQISFLTFLVSKERDIDTYRERQRRPRPPFSLELYPKGFIPLHLANRAKRSHDHEEGAPETNTDD
jgi:hypothetical protein